MKHQNSNGLKWTSLLRTKLAMFAVVILLDLNSAIAQEGGEMMVAERHVIEYIEGLPAIILEVEIAGQPVKALLDTGSNYLVVDDSLAPLLGTKLTSSEVTEVTGYSADQQSAITQSGRVAVDYYGYPSVELGSLALSGTISVLKDLSFISSVLGVEINTMISAEQIKDLIIHFDKNNRKVIVAKELDNVTADLSEFEKLDLIENRNKLPVISAKVEGIKASFLIDTGSNLFGTVHPGIIQQLEATVISTSESVASIQDHWKSDYIRPKRFQVGEETYAHQLLSIGSFNALGLDFLLHSSFILSPSQGALYIGKHNTPIEPGELDKSGLRLLAQDGRVVVFDVNPESPAFQAGIRRGDIITQVDRRDMSAGEIWLARQLFRGSEGDKLKVEYTRNGAPASTEFLLTSSTVP